MVHFRPIYIWAQAKDNQSQDDCYKAHQNEVIPIQDETNRQGIVYEMSEIIDFANDILEMANDDKSATEIQDKQNEVLKDCQDLSCYQSTKKVLLKIGTTDKDIANRQSNIDVFLDLEGINREHIQQYVEDFYQGFFEFCQITDRHPVDLDKNTHPDFLNQLLINNLSYSEHIYPTLSKKIELKKQEEEQLKKQKEEQKKKKGCSEKIKTGINGINKALKKAKTFFS